MAGSNPPSQVPNLMAVVVSSPEIAPETQSRRRPDFISSITVRDAISDLGLKRPANQTLVSTTTCGGLLAADFSEDAFDGLVGGEPALPAIGFRKAVQFLQWVDL
jgi:hypothetical protein